MFLYKKTFLNLKHTVNSLLDFRRSDSTRDSKPAAVEIVIHLAIFVFPL